MAGLPASARVAMLDLLYDVDDGAGYAAWQARPRP
jgi:hypothetical protein